MTKGKDQNSRGKKFQDRLPGEKRPRTTSGSDDNKPTRKDKPSGFGSRRPSGEDRPFSGRKPSGFGSDERSPRGRKPFGSDERSSYGRKPSGFGGDSRRPRPEGDDRGPRGRKPFGSDERSSYGRKPSGFGTDSRRPRPEGDERSPRGRKPSFGSDAPRTGRPARSGSGYRRETGSDETEKRGPRKPAGRYPKEDKFKKSTRLGASKNFKGSRRKHEDTGSDLEKANLLQGEEVRLNRYIANSGICSRREADTMIEQGLVQVNGKVVTELGSKVMPRDEVKVDGRRITPEKPVYIILNKPKGYITSTQDPEGRATVMDLIDLPGKERIYPIGRLDRNTTGVLLLTNDGELAQKLMHPSFEIKKVYRVKLDRKPNKDHMLAWVNGIELEDGFMAFEQCGFVEPEDDTILGVEIHSGRNRIVRRMFEQLGYEVEALDRVLLGEFDHVKLGRGKWRFLNDKETRYVEKLKRTNSSKRRSQ